MYHFPIHVILPLIGGDLSLIIKQETEMIMTICLCFNDGDDYNLTSTNVTVLVSPEDKLYLALLTMLKINYLPSRYGPSL